MTITITPTRATEGYYCEGACNSKESVSGRPVMRIDSGSYRYYRCSDCSLDLDKEVCCDTCGEDNVSLTTCSSCAGHDDCINSEDGHYYDDCDSGSCSNCGEPANYCDASCAIGMGCDVYCCDCGENIHNPNTCNDCKAESDCDECKNTSTGTPLLVGAASTITNPENVNEDGNVELDGIEFRF